MTDGLGIQTSALNSLAEICNNILSKRGCKIGPTDMLLDGKNINLTETHIEPNEHIRKSVKEALAIDLEVHKVSLQLTKDWQRVATFASGHFKMVNGYRSADGKCGYKRSYYVYSAETIRDSANLGCIVLVEPTKNAIVGCAAVSMVTLSIAGKVQQVGKVSYIAVHSEYRKRGLNTTLIIAVTDLIISHGLSTVFYLSTMDKLTEKAADICPVHSVIIQPENLRTVIPYHRVAFKNNATWRLAKPADIPAIKRFLDTAIHEHIHEVISERNQHMFVNHNDYRFTIVKHYVDPDTNTKSIVGLVRCYVQEQVYEHRDDLVQTVRKRGNPNSRSQRSQQLQQSQQSQQLQQTQQSQQTEVKIGNLDYLYLPNSHAFNEVASYMIEQGITMVNFRENPMLKSPMFPVLELYKQGIVFINLRPEDFPAGSAKTNLGVV